MEPRPWTQPLPAPLSPPDRFLHLRLRLADAWLAEAGEWRPIRDQPSAALWSILGYLRWHAPALMRSDPEAAQHAGPDAWLESRPLVMAIDAELAARGEIAVGDALVYLRAIGVAPWELPAAGPQRRSRRS